MITEFPPISHNLLNEARAYKSVCRDVSILRQLSAAIIANRAHRHPDRTRIISELRAEFERVSALPMWDNPTMTALQYMECHPQEWRCPYYHDDWAPSSWKEE